MPAEGKCHFACTHSERKCQKNQGNEQHRGWCKKDNEMLPPGSVKGVASHLPIDRTNLHKHLSTHTRPFQCQECAYAAATLPHRRKHMLCIHIIELGLQNHWVRQDGVSKNNYQVARFL